MGGREGLIDTAVKSVTGDTTIIIIEDGKSKYVKIGEWIDHHMDLGEADKQVFPEDRNMEFLKLDKKVYIPTCDQDGKTSWGELTAVTRHDPSEKLYEFTTLGGRKVTVADSESMLIWNDKTNIFEKKHSKDIKLDEYVPVTASLPEPPIINTYFDMCEYFPKMEYNFEKYNDIVKDKITDIKIISDHKEIKLYDVTVPSTLNFQIANGLNVRDTSTIQGLKSNRHVIKWDNHVIKSFSGSIIKCHSC
jgi:hypothetical protein